MRKSILSFLEKKGKNEKITMVSAYDYHSAKILDNCDIDIILVGGSKDNNKTPGKTEPTTPETCYILNTTQTFMKIIKEILVDGTSTYGVDTALVQRIRHAGFTNLNSWSKTDCNISSDDCVSKFNSALNLDFSGALQLADTRELLITNDPTYVKDSNDETSGILGYALNKGYITLTK